jgi:ABC-type spermidine/putrescine transport system permease subunit II
MAVSENDLLHAAFIGSLSTPSLAVAYVVSRLNWSSDHFYLLLLVFIIVGLISAVATLMFGLPFALWLHRRGSRRWTPICAYGAVTGMVILSPTGTAYGAVFGLANAVVFQAICEGKHMFPRPA